MTSPSDAVTLLGACSAPSAAFRRLLALDAVSCGTPCTAVLRAVA